jgi:hypothetical protein
MQRILLACVVILIILAPAFSLRVTQQHDYILNSMSRLLTGNSGSAYSASWHPNFSGWNQAGSSYSSSWLPNFGGWSSNRGSSAYAASWLPNFSGWGRQSLWKHNN